MVFTIGLVISFLVVLGRVETHRVPSSSDIRGEMAPSTAYAVSEKKAIKKSTQSAVRILSWGSKVGEVSVSSGTYFEHYGKYYVITVQHGLLSPTCDLVQVESDGILTSCHQVVIADPDTDYALLEIESIVNRTPLKFPKDFVRTYRGWKKSISLLHPLIYTGYPNTIGPVTLAGKIMGVSPEEFVYLNSYAWAGSSGSGVFNMQGKFVGYIVAIDVGHTEYGYDVLENVILVVPHYQIDWSPILRRRYQP